MNMAAQTHSQLMRRRLNCVCFRTQGKKEKRVENHIVDYQRCVLLLAAMPCMCEVEHRER